MLHEPHIIDTDLESKIDKLKTDYQNLSRLTVYATGNSVESMEDKDYVLSNRPYVEETLSKYFSKKQVNIQWLRPHQTGELYLDTNNGKFLCEIINDEDFAGFD